MNIILCALFNLLVVRSIKGVWKLLLWIVSFLNPVNIFKLIVDFFRYSDFLENILTFIFIMLNMLCPMFTTTCILVKKKIKNAEADGELLFYYSFMVTDIIASTILLCMVLSGHFIRSGIGTAWATIYINIVCYTLFKYGMLFLVPIFGFLCEFLKKKYKECYSECEKK